MLVEKKLLTSIYSMNKNLQYSSEPVNPKAFSAEFDRAYTRFSRLYDLAVKRLPVWRRWISRVLLHVEGPRVLEVSFGTGHLLGMYGKQMDVHGVELNREMIGIARRLTYWY